MRQIRNTTARSVSAPERRKAKPRATMDADTRLSLVYSTKKWRTLRKMVRDKWPTCVRCRTAAARVVDHIRPVQVFPAGAFDPRNVQPMCVACHDAKSKTIDAPAGDPSKYRHDLAHDADMRPPEMIRWADSVVASGHAARVIGDFAAGSDKLNRLRGWTPIC